MVNCVVKACPSQSSKDNLSTGISFHRIPKDPIRREKWTKIIRLLKRDTEWLPTNNTVICSNHFKKTDIIHPSTEKGNIRLKQDAVPMLVDETLLLAVEEMETDSLENVNVDKEMEEHLETPRTHKMRKTIDKLRIISSKRLQKIKNISRQNKRLKIKNQKLLDIITKLKKKRLLTEEQSMELNGA